MLENRVVRYLVYGVSAVVVSEVVYYVYQFVRKTLQSVEMSNSKKDVAEVIWTNELTQSCSLAHRQSAAKPNVSRSIKMLNGGCDDDGNGNDVGEKEESVVVGATSGRTMGMATPTTKQLSICTNRYCAKNNIGRLISWIDQTKYSIDLAMYTFTSHELSQAFERALKRGVVVRIVSDKEMVYSTGSQIVTLTKAGVPVRSPNSTMLMHHKFCILDGPLRASTILAQRNDAKRYDTKNIRGILLTGSLNWTMQGFGGNWENITITSNSQLVKQFENEFQRMWKAFNHKFTSPAKH